ncbi:hypothetical protein ADUPG1_005788, partial [Aduncisulcus paluster]
HTSSSPPDSILPAYVDRYTEESDDLHVEDNPLPEKFAIETIRIQDTTQAMKGLYSAKGPDGMTAKAAKTIPPSVWTSLFNKILSSSQIPTQWRHISATLLDKGGDKDPEDPSRWRPLFSAGQALRLMSSIIARKLTMWVSRHTSIRN